MASGIQRGGFEIEYEQRHHNTTLSQHRITREKSYIFLRDYLRYRFLGVIHRNAEASQCAMVAPLMPAIHLVQ